MGSSFGRIFRLTTWGESHGPALGVVVEGTPAGIPLADQDIQLQLDRRRVGQSKVTSPRGEMDRVEILSGVFEGITTGAPISLITYNGDVDSSTPPLSFCPYLLGRRSAQAVPALAFAPFARRAAWAAARRAIGTRKGEQLT